MKTQSKNERICIFVTFIITCLSICSALVTPTSPIHTLLLCRHGDSIWNGGHPGCQETFTGWTDVPLSDKGLQEAKNTGEELSMYTHGIDACFTSILSRAKYTAHHVTWSFSDKPYFVQPKKYITDYRLNERHYGALQVRNCVCPFYYISHYIYIYIYSKETLIIHLVTRDISNEK
jgi:hypothetical protein